MSFSDAHWNTGRTQAKPRVVDKELQRLKTLKVVTKTFQETPPPTITPSPTASTVSRCYSPVPSETWQSRRSSVYTDDGSSVVAPFRGRTLFEEPVPITPTPASATTTNTTTTTPTVQKQPSLHAYDLRKQRSFIVEEPLPIVNKHQQTHLSTSDSNVRKQSSFHQDYIRKQPSFHSEKSLTMASNVHHKKEEEEQRLKQQKQQTLLEARIAELESLLAKTKKELDLEREQHKKTKNELEGECATLRGKVTQLEEAAAKGSSLSPPTPLQPVEQNQLPHPQQAVNEEEEGEHSPPHARISPEQVASVTLGNNEDEDIREFTHQLDARLSVSREIDHLRIWEPPKVVADDVSLHRRDSSSIKDGGAFWRGMKKKLRV